MDVPSTGAFGTIPLKFGASTWATVSEVEGKSAKSWEKLDINRHFIVFVINESNLVTCWFECVILSIVDIIEVEENDHVTLRFVHCNETPASPG